MLTFSNFLQQGMGFLVLIRITRLLGPKNYGEYTVIVTIAGIGLIIAILGLRQIIIREVARNETVIRDLVLKLFKYVTISFSLTSILIVIYLNLIEKYNWLLIVFTIAIMFAQLIWNFLESFSFGKQEMKYSAVVGLLGSILWIIAIYITPTNGFSFYRFMSIFVSYQLFQTATIFCWEYKSGYFKKKDGCNTSIEIKEILKNSMAPYGTILLTLPITQLPILFLGIYSGKSEVGYYGIGNRLMIPITVVATNLLNAVYPILSKDYLNDHDLFYKNGRVYFWSIALLGVVITSGVSLFSKEIIPLLFGTKYSPAIHSFMIQALVALNIILHSFLGIIFLSSNKERLMVKLSAINAIIVGMSNYFGAHFGATGLAFSSWCSLFVGFSIHWYFINKYKLIDIKILSILSYGTLYVILSIVPILIPDIGIIYKMLLFILIFSVISISFIYNGKNNISEILKYKRL